MKRVVVACGSCIMYYVILSCWLGSIVTKLQGVDGLLACYHVALHTKNITAIVVEDARKVLNVQTPVL